MVTHQNFQSWHQSLRQGAIPSVPSDSDHLEITQDSLLDAISYLQFCHTYLQDSGLSKRYSQLFTAVADALNSTSEAIERCEDSPDETPARTPVTDAELAALNPFGDTSNE
jgi:hypothetical protein